MQRYKKKNKNTIFYRFFVGDKNIFLRKDIFKAAHEARQQKEKRIRKIKTKGLNLIHEHIRNQLGNTYSIAWKEYTINE